MWVIDHPTIIYLPLICAAFALGGAWWVTRKRQWMRGLLVVAGLATLYFMLTCLVDTDRKQIERTLLTMADGMKKPPLDKVFLYVSDQFRSSLMVNNGSVNWGKEELRQAATRACKDWGVEGIVIGDLEFKNLAGHEAVVAFTAKPLIGREYYTLPCPCEARFVREADGQWRMRELKVFNPFVNTTEPLNIPL
jgi:hypothetical protein